MRVRVPEAYLLVRTYGAKRPGFLILDGDGRTVDVVDLTPALRGRLDAVTLARRLERGWKAPSEERYSFFVGAAAEEKLKALRDRLARMPEVRGITVERRRLRFSVGAGKHGPLELIDTVRTSVPDAVMEEPVLLKRVREEGHADSGDRPSLRAWWSKGDHAVVASLLLPRSASPIDGHSWNARTATFSVPGVSLGPPGARTVLAAFEVNGVLAVFPDLAQERLVVVARPAVSWTGVRDAIRKHGALAKAEILPAK